MEKYRSLYNCLLESDELYVMFEGMTGIWEKDNKKFTKAQEELEDLTNLMSIDLDDDIDE